MLTFRINSKVLVGLLVPSLKMIPRKSAIQILYMGLLSLREDLLTVTSSDSENTLSVSAQTSFSMGEDSVCVDLKKIFSLVKSVAECELELSTDETAMELIIRYPNGSFKIPYISASEYPSRPNFDNITQQFSIPSSVLLSGIACTGFAAATETIRPIMTGINLRGGNEGLVFAASDTHILSRYKVTNTVYPEFAITIPAKATALIESLTNDKEGNVNISVNPKEIEFSMAHFSLVSRSLAGVYPNVDRVIPQYMPLEAIVSRTGLLNAIKRVSMASSASRPVIMRFTNGVLSLTCKDLDMRTSAVEELQCSYDGNPFVIGGNVFGIVKILEGMTTSEVLVKLQDPSRPFLFIPYETEENSDLVMLAMPMQILE